MEQSDEDLALRWRGGDVGAFEELFSRYEARVLGLAYRTIGNREDAEDVTQDTFIRANASIKSYRGGKFSTWLFRTAAHLSVDNIRSRHRRRRDLSLDEDSGFEQLSSAEPTPEALLLSKESSTGVWSALMAVPPHYRVLLVLRHIEGMQYEEIAQVLNCSTKSVGVRLCRAREALRKTILPWIAEETEDRYELQDRKIQPLAGD